MDTLPTRRVLLGAGLAVCVVGAASCAAAPAAVAGFNPATDGFFAVLGQAVFASAVYDLGKAGVQHGISWTSAELKAAVRAMGERRCFWDEAYSAKASGGQFLLVQVTEEFKKAVASDADCPDVKPMSDEVLIVMRGAKPVLLPAWAWQTLLLFHDEYTHDAKGQDLESRKALLKIALAPISNRVAKFSSPLNVTTSAAYKSPTGYVDIGRSKDPDGSYTGHIEVSGVLNASGKPYIGEYALPTRAA